MIPSQIARNHCANFNMSDGSCIGIYYNDDLSPRCCNPLSKCLLLGTKIQRCAYFEECVKPMKIEHGDGAVQKERNKSEFAKGIEIYLQTALKDEKKRV
jgi:hypothetical protein